MVPVPVVVGAPLWPEADAPAADPVDVVMVPVLENEMGNAGMWKARVSFAKKTTAPLVVRQYSA